MGQLNISLLGTFQVVLGGRPHVAFETDKTRALLAYLAVESNRPHRRSALAGILWPNFSESAARNSLRQTLFRLRQAISDPQNTIPHLLVSVHDVQFNVAADNWLDVGEFSRLLDACKAHHPRLDALCQACWNRLETAVGLYQGNFLAGFTLPNNLEFESWLLLKQEWYHRRMLEALGWLTNHCEQIGDYEQETTWAMREIEMEPWREIAHRRAMYALAMSGQRQAAIRQYDACRQILDQELGVEPVEETRSLYEAIRDRTLLRKVEVKTGQGLTGVALPHDQRIIRTYQLPFSSFVGLADEMAKLNTHLEAALAGQGNVVFVTGETGSGKTTLIGQFISEALRNNHDLLAAAGQCDARFGLGILYQPFNEILRMLGEEGSVGDWLTTLCPWKVTHQDLTQRVSVALPVFIQALVERGPELVGTMLSGDAIIQRVRICKNLDTMYQQQLEDLVACQIPKAIGLTTSNEATSNKTFNWGQALLLDQVTRVLHFMSDHYPLVLVLDDLQWADLATLSLLLHLGRQLNNRRILIIGAYRTEGLTSTDRGKIHPLESVVHELQRHYGDLLVDLDRATGHDFVNELLDSEPNRLEEPFRMALSKRTAGNPLFTVELLRGLQYRGDLIRDATNRWVITRSLDWTRLPSRVIGVIAERISGLPFECRLILTAASVQGREFIAEVVAHAVGYDTETVIHYLSSTISKEHQLVQACRVEFVNGRRLSRYRFLQALYQLYLYHELDEVERSLFYETTRLALETIYDGQVKNRALERESHLETARVPERVADFLPEVENTTFHQ